MGVVLTWYVPPALDPNAECTGYGYGPVTNALSQFPTILQIASILPNDGAALDKWASIQSSVPNIAPKVSRPPAIIRVDDRDAPADTVYI